MYFVKISQHAAEYFDSGTVKFAFADDKITS